MEALNGRSSPRRIERPYVRQKGRSSGLVRCAALATLAASLHACQSKPGAKQQVSAPFEKRSWSDASRMLDDADTASLRAAARQSLLWAQTQTPARTFSVEGAPTFRVSDLVAALNGFTADLEANPTSKQLAEDILPRYFELYESPGNSEGKVKSTGYYVPLVEGSLAPAPEYPVPVYAAPKDLVVVQLGEFGESFKGKTLRGRVDGNRLRPYWDRKAIRSEAKLETSAEPIAWVKDEVDLFVIEVQGSGILKDTAGQRHTISYSEQNGHAYKAVGRLLIDENKIPKEKMSMNAIRGYLRAHPAEVRRVLDYNPSFVFFRISDKGEISGNINRPLTPGRSVATDHKVFPPALPLLLSVEKPSLDKDGNVTGSGRINRIVFNQDTGGAIRGPGRVDFYWGDGEEAEAMASIMQHEGRLLALVPKPLGEIKSARRK